MRKAGKEYLISECATDLEAGLNAVGATGDPDIDAVLLRPGGGVAIVAHCPTCRVEGRDDHGLKIEQSGGSFRVTAFLHANRKHP